MPALYTFSLRCLFLIIAGAISVPLVAQDMRSVMVIDEVPEEHRLSPGNVSMRTGVYQVEETDFAVNGASEFALSRLSSQVSRGHLDPFGDQTHNWDISLVYTIRRPSDDNLSGGAGRFQATVLFNGIGSTFQSIEKDYPYNILSRTRSDKLEYTGVKGAGGEVYKFTSEDGVRIEFRPMGAPGTSDCSTNSVCVLPAKLTYPNGLEVVFAYDIGTQSMGRARLASVTRSDGYQIVFEHQGPAWHLVTKACLYDRTSVSHQYNCDGSPLLTSQYNYQNIAGRLRLTSVNNVENRISRAIYSAVPGQSDVFKVAYYLPDSPLPYVTNTFKITPGPGFVPMDVVTRQDFGDDSSLTYVWNLTPRSTHPPLDQPRQVVAGGTFTDSLGKSVLVEYGFPELPYGAARAAPDPLRTINSHFFLFGANAAAEYETSSSETSLKGVYVGPTFRDVLEAIHLTSLDNCYECSGSSGSYNKVVYQVTPGPSRIVDQLGRETNFNYCSPNYIQVNNELYTCLIEEPMVSASLPDGRVIKYDYAKRRLRSISEVSSDGSGEVRTASQSFGCGSFVCSSKPTQIKDARGESSDFTYDAVHGQILSAMSPPPSPGSARPLVLYGYALRRISVMENENSVLMPGVWVKVSERYCQTSLGAVDSLVCDPNGPDRRVDYEYGVDGGPNALRILGIAEQASKAGESPLARLTCFEYDAMGRRISETQPNARATTCE